VAAAAGGGGGGGGDCQDIIYIYSTITIFFGFNF